MRDTIFAPATAAGRGAVAIIRLSGPQAGDIATSLCGTLPAPRRATLRRLRDLEGETIDRALALWMPGPDSFTGEDCAEVHVHGGPAVVEGTCSALAVLGARLAEPGEFTRRAFEAGRLDLAQAEAIADLVDAETQAQRRQAQAQLGGALSQRYERWRELLLDALSYLEAGIDFPDEDVPDGVVSRALGPIDLTLREIERELESDRGERLRSGLCIALIGAPNVGKSSLLNALAGRDAAIVNARPGTTRDVVEVTVQIAGTPVVFADTAGLRSARGAIESEGVLRAERQADAADLRLAVADLTRPRTLVQAKTRLRPGDILVLNKADLGVSSSTSADGVLVSAALGEISALEAALKTVILARTAGQDFPAVTRARHRNHLTTCQEHLKAAQAGVSRGAELAAESLRQALRELENVTGHANPDAVLDRVFSQFCIGK